MQRPARTFVLPVPPSRMVAPYATIFGTAAGCWHRESYTTTNSIESLRREQAAHRGRRHLSQRRCHRPPVGTLLLEQKDEWAGKRARYMTLKPSVCPAVARGSSRPVRQLTPSVTSLPGWRSRAKLSTCEENFLFVHNKNVTNPPAHAVFGSSARAPPAHAWH